MNHNNKVDFERQAMKFHTGMFLVGYPGPTWTILENAWVDYSEG